MADDRSPLPKGRHREDDRGAHADRRFRRLGLNVLAVDLDPQGNLSDYLDVDPEASPTIGDVLSGRAKSGEAIHDGIIPANLGLAEAELMLGGKMGRELTLKKALREVERGLRPDPDRLPAGARTADRQRARGRPTTRCSRPRPVLRAPGSRAGARGDRTGPREPQPRPRMARRRAQHRRHAHPPLARGVRLAARALRGEAARHARSGHRSRTPSRPSARSRSSTTGPIWRSTTSTSPTSCCAGSGWTRPRRRLAPMLERGRKRAVCVSASSSRAAASRRAAGTAADGQGRARPRPGTRTGLASPSPSPRSRG